MKQGLRTRSDSDLWDSDEELIGPVRPAVPLKGNKKGGFTREDAEEWNFPPGSFIVAMRNPPGEFNWWVGQVRNKKFIIKN